MKPLYAAMALILTAPVCAEVSFKPYGYVQYDWNDVDDAVASDNDFRRVRAGFNLALGDRFSVKAEHDFNSHVYTDLFLRYSQGNHQFSVGHLKPPFSLEQMNSNRDIVFTERALSDALSIARRRGVAYAFDQSVWRFEAGAYDGNSVGALEGRGYSVRGIYAPRRAVGDVLHVGVSAGSERPDGDALRLSSRGEAASFMPTRLDTGRLTDVDRLARFGAEALWIQGPWSIQGEWVSARLTRTSAADADVSGGYLQASYLLSGERGYKAGVLDAPTLGEDGRGVELGVRWSRLDLDDGALRGGELDNLTLGVTWFLAPRTKLLLDYVMSDGERRGVELEPNLLAMRVQISI